jgi:hypothetical protein
VTVIDLGSLVGDVADFLDHVEELVDAAEADE